MADFDGVKYKISIETKTHLTLSMAWQCYKELERYGAASVLQREYGSHFVSALPGFDVTLSVDLQKLPADKGSYINRTDYQIICTDQAKRYGCAI